MEQMKVKKYLFKINKNFRLRRQIIHIDQQQQYTIIVEWIPQCSINQI